MPHEYLKRLTDSRGLPVVLMLALTLWLNSYFFQAVAEYGTIMLEPGEFYYDRLLNMSIAKAAEVWGSNYFDPFNRMEPIFYQFPGWWGLGFLARISGLQPWAAANLIHIFFVPAFFLIFWKFAGIITRNSIATLAGTAILFLFGNLEWFYSQEYLKCYGKHAVMLPFLQQIFGFHIDSYAMLFGYAALAAWLLILQTEKFCWKQVLTFWLMAIMAFNLHFLAAIFFIIAIMVLLFGITLSGLSTERRTRLIILLAAVAAAYLGALWHWSLRPPMTIIGVAAGLIWLLFFWHDRKRLRYLAPLLPLVVLALFAGANLLSVKSYFSYFLHDYNETVRNVPLAIPVSVLLICYAPVVVLAGVSLLREEEYHWRWFKWCLVTAAVVVICNDRLGYNNHPYRFIPYTYPLWAVLAGDGLLRLSRSWRRPAHAVILGLAILTLGLGVWANLNHRRGYAVSGNCQPVDPLVISLAGFIDEERLRNPKAIFYIEPIVFDVIRLAPYTGARFFYVSAINFHSAYRNYQTAEEMLQSAHDRGLRVDYVITPRILAGMVPVSELNWEYSPFLMYRVPE